MVDKQPEQDNASEEETEQASAPVTAAETQSDEQLITELAGVLTCERERADANMSGWQRAAADLANFRKEVERQRGETVRNANADMIRRLLPVVDDMERAFQTLPPHLADVPWVEGMQMIERKFLSVLEQEGIKQYSALGEEFDPAYHEAVVMEDTDPENDGKVIGELQKGYKFRDRVLRPALVRVGRGRKR